MRIRSLVLLCFALLFGPRSWAADQSALVGVWDSVVKQRVQFQFLRGSFVFTQRGYFDEATQAVRRSSFYSPGLIFAPGSLVSFRQDGSFQAQRWIGVPGRWRARGSRSIRYRIGYDVPSLNVQLNSVVSDHAAIRKRFVAAATFLYCRKQKAKCAELENDGSTVVSLIGYQDSGRTADKNRLELKGTEIVVYRVDYIEPRTKAKKVALMTETNRYLRRPRALFNCCSSSNAAANLAAGSQYLAENAKLPFVQTTASGLQIATLAKPNSRGKQPLATSNVRVLYVGGLPSGVLFDRSKPVYQDASTAARPPSAVTFELSKLIPGWIEGLQLMREGGTYRLFVPPNLGYGPLGTNDVPPNTPLVFDITLLKVL